MGLSIGGIGSSPYGMSYVQPMQYSISNEADVSDVYEETGLQGAVKSVPPVIYPNAQEISSTEDIPDDIKVVEKSQEANRMYNDIAEKFQGMTVGYDQSSAGMSYGLAGNSLDLYA